MLRSQKRRCRCFLVAAGTSRCASSSRVALRICLVSCSSAKTFRRSSVSSSKVWQQLHSVITSFLITIFIHSNSIQSNQTARLLLEVRQGSTRHAHCDCTTQASFKACTFLPLAPSSLNSAFDPRRPLLLGSESSLLKTEPLVSSSHFAHICIHCCTSLAIHNIQRYI